MLATSILDDRTELVRPVILMRSRATLCCISFLCDIKQHHRKLFYGMSEDMCGK